MREAVSASSYRSPQGSVRGRLRFGLTWRFSLALAALLLLAVGSLSLLVLREIEVNQRDRVEALLKQRGELANLRVQQTYLGNPVVDAQTFLRRSGPQLAADLSSLLSGAHVVLYDANGREAGNSLPLSRTDAARDTLDYAIQGKIAYEVAGDSLIYMAPLTWTIGQVGVVQIHYSLQADRLFYESVAAGLRNIGLGALTVSFLLGFLYVRRVVIAIRKLHRAAGDIREGRYLTEPPVMRRDELGELSEGIAYMSREIKSSFDRQKQFIGSVSHEFKTPLTSIIAYTDLLDMYRDDPQLLEEARASMRKEADRLLEMVEKVLRLSELEQYEFSQRAEPVALRPLLEESASRLQAKATQLGIAIHAEAEDLTVMADRESLVHIFMNVLDNAVKYNEPGGRVDVTGSARGTYAVVRVRDTGMGIPEEARAKLFEPFYTVSKDRARLSGGTGLGLSLVKRLVLLQGGTIELLPAVTGERGATFEITLPLVQSAPRDKRLHR
ncbi:sensor histidine kinase [Paenibacillus methanolicus]|uniref:histidine kinase n=1 Tax=Paenibacillus methanolicus TaxID=582686 RepID=A0A5S5C097_9BACL|nr:HAMP domain-containing sensor histidine kinase [Paenibacillus methanolicus]TYP71383.1 signal transduction histidine kinase [Paenibacillus methanolicus]